MEIQPTRSGTERRSGVDRRELPPEQCRYATVCAQAGVKYKGVQKGFSTPSKTIEDIVMFDDDRGSTCGLYVSKFNLDAVIAAVTASNAKWQKGRAA